MMGRLTCRLRCGAMASPAATNLSPAHSGICKASGGGWQSLYHSHISLVGMIHCHKIRWTIHCLCHRACVGHQNGRTVAGWSRSLTSLKISVVSTASKFSCLASMSMDLARSRQARHDADMLRLGGTSGFNAGGTDQKTRPYADRHVCKPCH